MISATDSVAKETCCLLLAAVLDGMFPLLPTYSSGPSCVLTRQPISVPTCTITLLAKSDATNCRRCLTLSSATAAASFSCWGLNVGMMTGGGGGGVSTPWFGRSSPAGTTVTQPHTVWSVRPHGRI